MRGIEGVEPRVLLVEDEAALAESVSYNLVREGFEVTTAADGEMALQRFRAEPHSIVILDLMLPKLSGLDVCRVIRAESKVPIIMLTAKDAEADKVAGLELGADDYVTKPFSMRELISRVRAHLRRAGMVEAPNGQTGPLAGGPVAIDPERHEASVRGHPVSLTPKEVRAARAPPGSQRAPLDPPVPDRGGVGGALLRRHQDLGCPRQAPPAEDRRGPPRASSPADGPRARIQVRRIGPTRPFGRSRVGAARTV